MASVETVCLKVRLKPDSIERVREWAAELENRDDEVLATLREEGVVVESAFLDRTSDGDFLIYYMKSRTSTQRRKSRLNPTIPSMPTIGGSSERRGKEGNSSNN